MLALVLIGTVAALAVPAWAKEDEQCPKGEKWDAIQSKCVPETTEGGAASGGAPSTPTY